MYSYLLYDGTEYVELTNYNNYILCNYEIDKVLTFLKINCRDNCNGYDNFVNKKKIKLEISKLTNIEINSSIQITKDIHKNLKIIENNILKNNIIK